MTALTVDVRMLDAAGIGTYLRNVLPRVVGEPSAPDFVLLGDPASIAKQGLDARRGVRVRAVHSPIYSVAEQWELWRSSEGGGGTFWAPHYNFPLLHRGRLVVTVHDVLHLARPEFVAGVHRRAYARAMFAALRARADAILCVSRFTADELVRHASVDPRRIEVIHEGVDAERFGAAAAAPVAEPHPRPFFLFVGNVKPHKNLVRLVEAFASLAEVLPHDLLIVGKREGFITGDARVGELAARLSDRVRFTGYVGDEVLLGLLRHAEALVFPSLYEGFGLPPLEAMASGCPVLASRAGALPEVCGDAALYFDPLRPVEMSDCMRRLAGDPALADDLRARGRERVREFSWDRCASRTADVLLHCPPSGRSTPRASTL